jgi:hypothetical protein
MGIKGFQGFEDSFLFLGGMAGSAAMHGKRGGPGGPSRKTPNPCPPPFGVRACHPAANFFRINSLRVFLS